MTAVPKYIGFEIELGAHFQYGFTRSDGLAAADALRRAHEVLCGLPAPAAGCGCGRNEFGAHLFRAYCDHLHFEVSSPLAVDAQSLVRWQHRAKELALACRSYGEAAFGPIRVHLATTSRQGAAWGFHVNILVSRGAFDRWRERDWQPLMPQWVPFLVTSPVLFGTGKVGSENGRPPVDYQLSQRADFVDDVVGLETVASKSLINERDEPLADRTRYARFHVSAAFDLNLMEFASWLKFGCVQIVLALIETGADLPDLRLRDPLASLQIVSRDLSLSRQLELADGRMLTAIQLQLELAQMAHGALDRGLISEQDVPDAGKIIKRWIETLGQLRKHDPILLRRLDWISKKRTIDHARRYLKCVSSDPRLTAVDLRFAELHGGTFESLARRRMVDRLPDFLPGMRLAEWPKCSARDEVRRVLIDKFASGIAALDWDSICLLARNDGDRHLYRLVLDDPLDEFNLRRAAVAARTIEDLVGRLPPRLCSRVACGVRDRDSIAVTTTEMKGDGSETEQTGTRRAGDGAGRIDGGGATSLR